MMHYSKSFGLLVIAVGLATGRAQAFSLRHPSTPIVTGTPALAPFQHVRFCRRYPSDCAASSNADEAIAYNAETMALLSQVNRSVNSAIAPRRKTYESLQDAWSIAPDSGDCNDYAVTKRHELLKQGLPSKALRLSVVTTSSGLGHLVLLVTTSKADLVMDNLSEEIRPWQSVGYHWVKIQSVSDSKLWYGINNPVANLAGAAGRVRMAGR
jgi:predicted transglutaminase-like cysteine proteinase